MNFVHFQRKWFVSMMLVIFASPLLAPAALADAKKDQAASALASAQDSVASAYQAVSRAEEARANVSSLLIRLNEAGSFLARAQLAYQSGNYNSTMEFAAQSQQKLNGFLADVDSLREAAIQEHYVDFMINVVGSTIGSMIVVCLSFLVWSFLKRRLNKDGSI